MSCDDRDDWPETKWFQIRSGGTMIEVRDENGVREDALRRRAARMLLSGVMTPDFIAQIPK